MWTRADWAYAAAMSGAVVVVAWLAAIGFGVRLPGPGFSESAGAAEVAVPIAPEPAPTSEIEPPSLPEEPPVPEQPATPAEESVSPTPDSPPTNDPAPTPAPEPSPEGPLEPALELLEGLSL